MNDEVLTIEEAAGVLKVDAGVVTELLESGKLPGRLVGGAWRTTTRAIVGFVDGISEGVSCCVPVPAEGAEGTVVCCQPASGGKCC